jgi:hypothetical protein
MSAVFTDAFLKTDPNTIAEAIRTDGFFTLQGALSPEWLAALSADVAANPFAINKNWITGVYAENQYYLNQMMACSRAFVDYATHEKIFSVCDTILGAAYRLKAMRYYETYGHHLMQWHTDNKTDRSFAHIPGLIFICYIEDVEDGEFQYVRGSQNWSGDKAYSDYTDEFIQTNHGKDVVSFKAPKGTIVIYDTYGIHRAKPVLRGDFVRKSLFFQVDSKVDSAEPLLLNPSYLTQELSPKLQAYLGFGKPAEYDVFPRTNLKTLQLRRLNALQIIGWLAYRTVRFAYNIAPPKMKNVLRSFMGKHRV